MYLVILQQKKNCKLECGDILRDYYACFEQEAIVHCMSQKNFKLSTECADEIRIYRLSLYPSTHCPDILIFRARNCHKTLSAYIMSNCS